MKKLMFGLVLAVATVAASAADVVWYSEDGQTFVLPEKKKIVVVPWWWDMAKIQYHMDGAVLPQIEAGVAPTPKDDETIPEECENYGKLVVAPSVVPAYCSQYFE